MLNYIVNTFATIVFIMIVGLSPQYSGRKVNNMSEQHAVVPEKVNISDTLQCATLLEMMLRAERRNGNITFEKPITQAQICKRFNDKFRTDIKTVNIRKWINFLRKRNVPIGTYSRGCWYITDPKEYDILINHLTARTRDIEEIIRIAKREKENMLKRMQGLPLEQSAWEEKGAEEKLEAIEQQLHEQFDANEIQ